VPSWNSARRSSQGHKSTDDCPSDEREYTSRKFIEECLRLLQIRRVKSLDEPAIDRGQQVIRFFGLALGLPQASDAGDGGRCRVFRGNRLRPEDRICRRSELNRHEFALTRFEVL
jgi:hypothetical protein